MDNFRTSLPTDNKSTDGVMDFVSNVNLCLNNIRNTNAFMLMTINRCIDYSKASKGMQLIPRYESLNLLEAIQLPISCMINMQNRIQVHLQPFPTEICSHILTDKQWLQENMLCLLSNAVKYSSIGEVIVCVSMVRASSSSTTTPSEDIAPPPPSACMQANDHEGKESIHHEHTFNMYKSNLPSTTTRVAKGKNAEESGWYLRIEVEDAGIGMSEQDMQLLFHPIKQTQRFAGGTGLGLYSLAKRVEALHGEYGVKKRSDNSHGLLFWFTIPYRPDPTYLEVKKGASSQGGAVCVKLADPRLNPIRYPVDQCPSSMSVKAVANVKAPLQSLTILLVDDSHSILKMTSMMLTKLGHHVITAENGLVALQKITSYLEDSTAPKIDLILMDLQMPVMDGLEATKRIRQAEVNLPSSSTASLIIGVSANSDHETTKASYEAGVDAFLSKPFNIASFQEIYQKVLFARLALADNITSSGSNQLES